MDGPLKREGRVESHARDLRWLARHEEKPMSGHAVQWPQTADTFRVAVLLPQ